MMKLPKIKRRSFNRSVGGDVGINVMLFVFGAFMFLPMVYAISQSLKPLDELWMFPPRFFVINPTFKNFSELFRLMSESWVPFSRYIFNTAFVSVGGTFGHLFLASMAAYAMTKINFPGRKGMFMLVYYSLMFHSTVSALSNFIIMSEKSMLSLVETIGLIYMVLLVIVGMMVTHDYPMGKNIVTIGGTIIAMVFIMFVAVLFSTLLTKIVSFVSNIVIELRYRM